MHACVRLHKLPLAQQHQGHFYSHVIHQFNGCSAFVGHLPRHINLQGTYNTEAQHQIYLILEALLQN